MMLRLLFLFLFLSASLGMAQNTDQSFFAKAESLYNAAQYEKARPLFEKVLERDPDNKEVLEYLGDIAGYAKKWDKAIPYYEKLVKQHPKEANYHFKYGGVLGMKALEINRLLALGLIGDIKESFETAARLDERHIEARWALVEFYIQLPGIIGGSEAKAKKYANELLSISKVDGYLAHGYVAENTNNPEEAERNFKAAIKVGGSMTCYEKLQEHYEKNRNGQKALETVEEAQSKYKNENNLHYQLGKVAGVYGIGLDKGIACLKVYIQNHSAADGVPKDWAYYRMAQIYKHKGEKQLAAQWIDKALKSRPDFKEALAEKREILNL